MANSIFEELKRRNVFKVTTGYVLLGWLVLQVADVVVPILELPEWTLKLVLFIGILGFPFAVFFAWAYELTPDGIKKDSEVTLEEAVTTNISQKLNLTIIALLVVTLGYYIYNSHFNSSNQRPSQTLSSNDSLDETSGASIAVLPLLNMSADPENVFFAGGVHEDILTNLSRIDDLKVVSRTSVTRYINSDLNLRDIGIELGARYIVEGSVRMINNHVRVTVQLIDATADTHLWANNYDRELVDIFATQSALAKEISNSLHLEIQPGTVGTLQDMPTHSVKAYDLYMKARSIDRSEAQSEASLTRQRELLEASIAEDPDFVEAWAYLNEVYDMCLETLVRLEWFIPEGESREFALQALREKAIHALKKAVALDPDNVETLIARAAGIVGENALNDVGEDFFLQSAQRKEIMDRIIEEYPQNAMGWYILGWWQNINKGNSRAASAAFKKALQLDPLHARIVEGSLASFRAAGDEEMVTLLFERLAQIAPEKVKDKSLSQIDTAGMLSNLQTLLVSTADESLIDIYAEELVKPNAFFDTEIRSLYFNTQLSGMQNNLQAIVDLQNNDLLIREPEEVDLLNYLTLNSLVMRVLQLNGQTKNLAPIAQRIVRLEPMIERDIGFDAVLMAQILVEAYSVLGKTDEARKWTDRLLTTNDSHYDTWGGLALTALAIFDVDQAVSDILEREKLTPQQNLTDWFAFLHITFRPIIIHPDMQAFFVKEGKWVDYLAERVPEYARYRKR